MKLIDILRLIDRNEVPVSEIVNADILQGYDARVNICYMSEEETWIKTYISNTILVPLYNAEVDNIEPAKDEALNIWINSNSWLNK